MAQLNQVKDLSKASAADSPQSLWDRVVASTPVVMTVVATILAGLSSGEMSTAQYHRALAAQFQSKAGDQWNFYQAKRLRQNSNENMLELMQGLTGAGGAETDRLGGSGDELVAPASALAERVVALGAPSTSAPATAPASSSPPPTFQRDAGRVKELAVQWQKALAEPDARAAMRFLLEGQPPHISEKKTVNPRIVAVLSAIAANQNEIQTIPLVRQVKREDLDEAEGAANQNAIAFDTATKPVTAALDRLQSVLAAESRAAQRLWQDLGGADGGAGPDPAASAASDAATSVRAEARNLARLTRELLAGFTSARLRFDARRYAEEGRFNMAAAQLLEVEVRRSSSESDRNRLRSKNFFYGMLAAQAAVTIATLSLAVKQRSLLWGLASGAGLVAILLGIYVYLFT